MTEETKSAEVLAFEKHERRMRMGCRICRRGEWYRLCPDCYTCRHCGAGCEECASVHFK